MKTNNIEIPWYVLCSCSELYLMTQQPDFSSHPDADKILDYLNMMEGVRPEDVNGKYEWRVDGE